MRPSMESPLLAGNVPRCSSAYTTVTRPNDGSTHERDISTFEVRVKESSPLAGKTLADARFPAGSLVVAIARDGETLFPMASTRVMLGDIVTVMSDASGEDDLRAFLEGRSGR